VIDSTDAASPYATASSLVDASSYYACVQTHDAAGRVASWVSTGSKVTIDLTNPTDPTVDAPPSYATSNSYSLTWSGGTDTNFDYYKVRSCANNDCSTGCIVDVTDTASPNAITGLIDGSTYYSCVQTHDLAGRTSNFVASASKITADFTDPTSPTVSNPPNITSVNSYSVTWSGGTDANFDYYRIRACTNTDCSTGCAVDSTSAASP
jgi:fibronectin type 3 domain-containing protein